MLTGPLEAITNDQDYSETLEILTDVTDFADWDIEFVVVSPDGCSYPATVTKDLAGKSFTASLPLGTVQRFCEGTYRVGCRYTVNGVTLPLMACTLPVIEGNFTP